MSYPKPQNEGNGDPNCPECQGRGVVITGDLWGSEVVKVCKCVIVSDTIRNVDRGWKGLFKAPVIKSSPLLDLVEDSVWITCERNTFRSHLRHVAVRMGPVWGFKVVSDHDLMAAWLGSTALKRAEIHDADMLNEFAGKSLRYHSLSDLVEPPELLVIQLGVKSSRNSAMPEVFEEALSLRESLDLPTWVFDQPTHPYNESHLCYSLTALDRLYDFERVKIGEKVSKTKRRGVNSTSSGMVNLSSATGSRTGNTKAYSGASKPQTKSGKR